MRLINNKLIIITNHIVVPLLFDALESLYCFSFVAASSWYSCIAHQQKLNMLNYKHARAMTRTGCSRSLLT